MAWAVGKNGVIPAWKAAVRANAGSEGHEGGGAGDFGGDESVERTYSRRRALRV